MKNYIYIITKDGKIFTKEGIEHVFNKLFGDKSDHKSVVEMGDTYNSPFVLSRNLKKHISSSYIVIFSNKVLTYIMGDDNIKSIIEILDNNETANSWNLIKEYVEK